MVVNIDLYGSTMLLGYTEFVMSEENWETVIVFTNSK